MVPHVLRADKNSATIGQRDGKFGAGGSQPRTFAGCVPGEGKSERCQELE